jgi:hypothetical protein
MALGGTFVFILPVAIISIEVFFQQDRDLFKQMRLLRGALIPSGKSLFFLGCLGRT